MNAIEPLYVDIEQASQLTTLGRSTIEAEIRAGNFPKPRMLTARRTAYLFSEVKAWAQSRPVSDLPPPANTGHSNRRRTTSNPPTGAQPASTNT